MVKIRVPATTANMGTGIDALGLALNMYLTVELSESDKNTVEFANMKNISISPEDNYVYQAAKRIYERADKLMPPLYMKMDTQIPFSRGLGSSASAIIAGMWGANQLLGSPFTKEELIQEAGMMEGHFDNIMPAVLGGFTIAMPSEDEAHFQRTEIGSDLKIIVAIPDYRLSTSKARSVLPTEVPLKTVLKQVGRAAYLSAAILRGEYDALDLAMEDLIFTPARKNLIPGFDAVIKNAKNAGAITAVISGSGPTIIAFATGNEYEIGRAMEAGFKSEGISSTAHILLADNMGVSISTEK